MNSKADEAELEVHISEIRFVVRTVCARCKKWDFLLFLVTKLGQHMTHFDTTIVSV